MKRKRSLLVFEFMACLVVLKGIEFLVWGSLCFAEAKQSPWEKVDKVTFSGKEKRTECQKYEGKFISYYGRLFKVRKCLRHEITDPKLLRKLTADNQVAVVDNLTIIKLDEGEPYGEQFAKTSCEGLDGFYIVTPTMDINYVQKCARYGFPDWDTFEDHRKEHDPKSQRIVELSDSAYKAIPVAKVFPSILDEEFRDSFFSGEDVIVIPIDEACSGLNNRFVTYFSKVYKIEDCRKRSVDPVAYSTRYGASKVTELSSEQWISLPVGPDYTF